MKVIKLNVKYVIGESVYLKADENQNEYIVIEYKVTATDVLYRCSNGGFDNYFYGFELSKEKRII